MNTTTRPAMLAVVAALLLVTAGCGGGTVPSDMPPATAGSETATAATPTSVTVTQTASVDQYPPGVAANGSLSNVTALVDAHFDVTTNQSIVLTQRWSGPNESVVRRYAHGDSPTPYYSTVERTTDGRRVTGEFYSTGAHGYAREGDGNRTAFHVLQNSTFGVATSWTRDAVFGPRYSLRSALSRGNYSVNGIVERNGRTLVRLTTDQVASNQTGVYESFDSTVLVTPEGVVYGVDSSFVVETGEGSEAREHSMTLETDVEWSGPPSWVADLPHLSVSPVEDGHALAIRNTGGATLPANVSFTVTVSNRTDWSPPGFDVPAGTVTTVEPLEPGDAVYVTVDGGDESASLTLHDEPTRGEYSIAAADVYGEHGTTFYRLVMGVKGS